jgi:hypothetical protein
MNKAKSELIGALATALALVVFLVWYQGQRSMEPAAVEPAVGRVARTEAAPPAAAPVPTTEAESTVAVAAPAAPAPELLPADVLARDRAFINEAFPALSSWDVAEVKPLLSVAALASSTDEDLEQVMTTLENRLGSLQSFDLPQPVATRAALDRETETSADLQPYEFTAYYAAGEAEVSLVLEKQPQHSSLYSFDIHVPN